MQMMALESSGAAVGMIMQLMALESSGAAVGMIMQMRALESSGAAVGMIMQMMALESSGAAVVMVTLLKRRTLVAVVAVLNIVVERSWVESVPRANSKTGVQWLKPPVISSDIDDAVQTIVV